MLQYLLNFTNPNQTPPNLRLLFLRPCLVHTKNQKLFKISRHIESCGTCMKH